MEKMKVVIITGMSGAGRSRAADWFEDQGYYCLDNIPPALIKHFLEMARANGNQINKVAFVIDARSTDFFTKAVKAIEQLKTDSDIELTVVYLQANAKTIVKRYNEVRRSHPLTGSEASLAVIEEEIDKLKEIKQKSDYIIDTTDLKVPELHAELDKIILGGTGASNFAINICSFGFKYGIPSEADIMFDVRFLNNPYWVPSLKKLSGKNKKVVDYVFKDPLAEQFVEQMHATINILMPGYIEQGKYHLNVAFGCTGGHHRSVAIAEAIAASFKDEKVRVKVSHRDL